MAVLPENPFECGGGYSLKANYEKYQHPLEQITDHYQELLNVIRLSRPEELKNMIKNIDQIKLEMERQLLRIS